MKKYLYITCLIFMFSAQEGVSQQMAQSTFMEDAKHYWNPAVTGIDKNMRTSLFFRQQWLGFGGAPRTGFVSFEYPFIDMNMSAGALINFDQTGPVSKKGLQLMYAYKLRDFLGEDSQLSLGINAGFQQYGFDPASQTFNDVNDVLLQGNSTSTIYPIVGGGVYFLSNTKEYDGNVFFAGFAYRNAFTTDVLINDSNQKRERHIHFNVGTRVYSRYSFIEPSITVNYTAPEQVDIRAGLRFEMEDAFWAGLGYSTINEVSLQGGFIVPEFGNRYAKLRVGVLGNIGMSGDVQELGPGFEIFIGYLYDID
ncbi:MAG: PorP/SprF family type IX secretion system membrane protein [Saprospiraceae bacterium]|nr:PorP/SprF family type IX secretion system membrane protein [Saprospiraceae bacterium]